MVWLILLLATPTLAFVHSNPNYAYGRTTMVHLFEWKWDDIADECETFLGPNGFGGIEISPPNENLVIWSHNRPWWERYQPISYRLYTRSGNEQQLQSMIRRCNNVGVRIYVDAILNHMTGTWPDENFGTGGSGANFAAWEYPSVPYTSGDFNWPHCVVSPEDYVCCSDRVRNCELSGLKDLNQGSEYVRGILVSYMNRLIDLGVAGFRITAAKHMYPFHLQIIYNRLHNLNTRHGFIVNSRPYIYHEVIENGNEAISRDEYVQLGAVTEFRYGLALSKAFQGRKKLSNLYNWGVNWNFLPTANCLTFLDNHDTQRGHVTGGQTLTHKTPRDYKAAVAFMLAHPFCQPQVMSSYNFTDIDAGPPMNRRGDIISPIINDDGLCEGEWICEHRWHQIYQMVGFRNIASGTRVNNWWDNRDNQIAFSRGRMGFIAFNRNNRDLNSTLVTGLPAGFYCDIISGAYVRGRCTGKMITVGRDTRAHIHIGANDTDMFIAIHVGPSGRFLPWRDSLSK